MGSVGDPLEDPLQLGMRWGIRWGICWGIRRGTCLVDPPGGDPSGDPLGSVLGLSPVLDPFRDPSPGERAGPELGPGRTRGPAGPNGMAPAKRNPGDLYNGLANKLLGQRSPRNALQTDTKTHLTRFQNGPANPRAFQTDSQTHSPMHLKRIPPCM